MKRLTKTFLMLMALSFVVGLTGCKTTEKNYRQAYERAISDNDRDVTEFEHTIYNRHRARMKDIKVDVDSVTIDAKSIYVKVTPNGGGISEWLKKYSVVVAEFKQLFNAQSMRERFAGAGYPRTFIVENAEPYYYVVVDSSRDALKMSQLADSLRENSPLPLKPGFPYVLMAPGPM